MTTKEYLPANSREMTPYYGDNLPAIGTTNHNHNADGHVPCLYCP